MSGIKRAILAELTRSGKTGAAAIAEFTPEKIRAEKGRTIHSTATKNPDQGEYLGRNGKDATPKK